MPVGVNSDVQKVAVAGSSAQFTNPMQPGHQYIFWSDTDCYINVAATGGSASATDLGVKAGQAVPLKGPERAGDATTNFFVHVIQNSAAGRAQLARIG